MCKPGPRFKLCSCAEKELEKTFWRLTRGNTVEIVHWVGDIIPPDDLSFSPGIDANSFLPNRLQNDLNHSDIFDFAYQPKNGDLLIVNFDESWIENGMYLEFTFTDGSFCFVDDGVEFQADGEVLAQGTVSQI